MNGLEYSLVYLYGNPACDHKYPSKLCYPAPILVPCTSRFALAKMSANRPVDRTTTPAFENVPFLS